MELSGNGVDFGEGVRTFEYHPSISISLILPTRATAFEAMSLTVLGHNFPISPRPTFARVGSTELYAATISSTSLSVLTPALPPGNLTISISSNRVDWVSSSRILQMDRAPQIVSVSPSFGLPSASMITVRHLPFHVENDLDCVFSTFRSRATRLSSDLASCQVPDELRDSSFAETGFVQFQICDGSLWSNRVPFLVLLEQLIPELVPSSGPVGGGTLVAMKLSGSGIMMPFDPGELQCTFGGVSVLAARVTLSPPSTWNLECRSPVALSPDAVFVSITGLNIVLARSKNPFLYSNPQALHRLIPTRGTAGMMVTVIGENLLERSDQRLRVGRMEVRTYPISSSQINFLVPSHMPLNASVELLDSQESGLLYFQYVDAVVAFELFPSMGPQSGGTHIFLSFTAGSTFVKPTHCVIETQLIPLQTNTQNKYTCITPPQTQPGAVNVTTATNGEANPTRQRFLYLLHVELLGFMPSFGATQGGTP
eukprot:2082962-Rhodomonas_salina.1